MVPQGMEDQYTRITLPFKWTFNSGMTTSDKDLRMSLRHTVEKEGLYYVLVGSCQAKTSNIVLSGSSTAKNTYGQLSATLYGELPFNLVLIGLFSLGLLYWFIICYYHSKSILSVHRIILVSSHIGISSIVHSDFVCCGMHRLQNQRSGHELQWQSRSRSECHFHSHSLRDARSVASYPSPYRQRVSIHAFLNTRHGSVDNAQIFSPSVRLFFVTIYSMLQTSFELQRETRTSVSLFASTLPVLFHFFPFFQA